MGLMDQFRQPQNSRLSEVMGLARQVTNGNPRAFVQQLADSGATCTLPNGKVMSVKDLASMAEGKTPQQLLSELGL